MTLTNVGEDICTLIVSMICNLPAEFVNDYCVHCLGNWGGIRTRGVIYAYGILFVLLSLARKFPASTLLDL